jgi:hypothetical protein
MNARVPDRAIVPSASIMSASVMPMPLSATVSRRASASSVMVIRPASPLASAGLARLS